MKLKEMKPCQIEEINALVNGARYISRNEDADKINELEEITNSTEFDYPEMHQRIIRVIDSIIDENETKRYQLENYFRLMSAWKKTLPPHWRL